MSDKLLFELTIISNISIEPFLVQAINRIFEQNEIQVNTVAVNYDEYDSLVSLSNLLTATL